jgi:hypothetical protein
MTYTLSHTGALTTGPTEFTVSEFNAPASVSFAAGSVTVPAGGTAAVNVTITAPTSANLYTYGGYLVATPQLGGIPLRVPYMGVTGDYQAVTVLSLSRLTRGDLTALGDGTVFTMADAANIPYIVFHLAHAARTLRVDIYSAASGGGLGKSWQRAFQFEYLSRNSTSTGVFTMGFDGQTSNGRTITVLPNGNYIAVITVLKPLGDPTNPADVETWTSPMFTIARP